MTYKIDEILDTIIHGDALKELESIPSESVDMIFADPPYNLSGKGTLTVHAGKPVECNKGEWDQIDNFEEFCFKWLTECKRILKPKATIWISGTLHSHPMIGYLLKKLDMWIINDIIWYKPNAPPQLQPNRCAPCTELIWFASRSKKYYFDYDMGKIINGGKQLRSLWQINAKRHITKHPTEKPEILLKRILLLGSKENDIVLDPFLGSGTTAVVAKRLNRRFIGIEINKEYIEMANERIAIAKPIDFDNVTLTKWIEK